MNANANDSVFWVNEQYPAKNRADYVDFSPITFWATGSLILRQPSGADMSFFPHTLEFLDSSWTILILVYASLWIVVLLFICVMRLVDTTEPGQLPMLDIIKDSLALCLRAYISKVNPFF